MRTYRRTFLVAGLAGLTLSWVCLPTRTAPVPESRKLPQKKLDELKKQLPTLLQDESLKAIWNQGAEVRLVRLVGPAEAKVRILVPFRDNMGQRRYLDEMYLLIYLHFYNDRWTTTRFEGSWPNEAKNYSANVFAHRVMDLIDEATEK
jgi:hypothetical protein